MIDRKIFTKEYFVSRISKIMVQSDLLTTRFMVGMASLIFAVVLSVHYFDAFHGHDLIWIIFSLLHAIVTFWSLYTQKNNWFTFCGEAICGFVLWNYIGISMLLANDSMDFPLGAFTPSLAPFSPTFIAGISTWWILSRYPKITEKGQ